MLRLGVQMFNITDGRKGVVEEHAGELRIAYLDRGEKLYAGKQEKWEASDAPKPPLRREEMLQVAYEADRVLRGLERHELIRHWEPANIREQPYDEKLVGLIVDYLGART